MRKLSFAEAGFTSRSVKTTRKKVFLSEMESVLAFQFRKLHEVKIAKTYHGDMTCLA